MKPCPLCNSPIDDILSACARCLHARLTYSQRNSLSAAEAQHRASAITGAELDAIRRQIFSHAKGA